MSNRNGNTQTQSARVRTLEEAANRICRLCCRGEITEIHRNVHYHLRPSYLGFILRICPATELLKLIPRRHKKPNEHKPQQQARSAEL